MPDRVSAVQTDRRPAGRRRADGTVRRSDAAGELRAGVRQLRGQHGSALQPAVQRRDGTFIPLIDDTKYPNIGDRLTESASPGPGTPAAGTTPRPETRARCSSTTISRSTTSPHTRRASRVAITCRTRTTSGARSADRQPADGELRQAIRCGERASRLCQRQQREHAPRRSDQGCAEWAAGRDTLIIVTYDEFGGQWDHVSPPGADT